MFVLRISLSWLKKWRFNEQALASINLDEISRREKLDIAKARKLRACLVGLYLCSDSRLLSVPLGVHGIELAMLNPQVIGIPSHELWDRLSKEFSKLFELAQVLCSPGSTVYLYLIVYSIIVADSELMLSPEITGVLTVQ